MFLWKLNPLFVVRNLNDKKMNILKRTLTPKSKWDLTKKYEGYTVGQLMEIHPSTLYWGYTHLEKIDFCEEVLEFFEKTYSTFERISKPSIDKEQFENFINGVVSYESMSYEKLKNLLTSKRVHGKPIPVRLLEVMRNKKVNRGVSLTNTNRTLSKVRLQSINHGH